MPTWQPSRRALRGGDERWKVKGFANFARAFQQAGARSVLVSLWEVASEPAVEFMTAFYSHSKAGESRALALRHTRNEIKTKYPSPFYWAVFILHGE